MSNIFKKDIIKNNLEVFEVFVALILISSVWMGYITAKDLIVNILLFIVFVELTRMLGHFLSKGNFLKIRYLIDGSIAFLLRELIIAISDHHIKINERIIEITIILVTLSFLFIYRYIATKYGPTREEETELEKS